MGEGLLIAVTRPLALDESVGIEPANFRRPISAIGIHHNDLGAPSETLQTDFDPVLFIETNDNRRDGGGSFVAAR
jgi:hypothetical protein